jgi:hypothetical protein
MRGMGLVGDRREGDGRAEGKRKQRKQEGKNQEAQGGKRNQEQRKDQQNSLIPYPLSFTPHPLSLSLPHPSNYEDFTAF